MRSILNRVLWDLMVFLVLTYCLILIPGGRAGAAQYSCLGLSPASLPGRTLWLRIDAATAPYETNGGPYAIRLLADGSYSVAATNGVAARSGTWSAAVPGGELVITMKGFHGDAVNDLLVLFGGCLNGATCTSCGYALTREGTEGLQSGSYTLTDGELPLSNLAPVVTAFSGGGIYPSGANVFLYPQSTGNPNTLKAKWYKDNLLVPGATFTFLSLSAVTPADSGVYRVEISNSSGTTKVSTMVAVHPASDPATHLGRPWVKIVDEQTLVPGTAFKLSPIRPRSLYLRDARVQILDGAGKALVRWGNGGLETVVAVGAALPGGATVDSVIEATEESDGASDFYVRHSSGYGVFEAQGGTLTPVAAVGAAMPGGGGNFAGFLWLARRNGKLVFSAANTSSKVGIYSWDGNALSVLLAPGAELPGLLGPIQQALSLKFDGSVVALQANDGVQYLGNNRQGVFRYSAATGWKEVANATQAVPGNPSFPYKIFNGVDVLGGAIFYTAGSGLGYQLFASDAVGTPRFAGPSASPDLVNAFFSVANPLQVLLRNSSSADLVGNGVSERVLGAGEILGGKQVTEVLDVDAQGIDMAVALKFDDGSTGVYAALGSPVTDVPLQIETPIFVEGQMRFSFATVPGARYNLEFKGVLSDVSWAVKQTLNGDGTTQTLSVTAPGGSGFFRLVQIAP